METPKITATETFTPKRKNSNGKWVWNYRLKAAKKQGGIYVIKERKTGKYLYVGYSAKTLETTFKRHGYSWDNRKWKLTDYLTIRGSKHHTQDKVVFDFETTEILCQLFIFEGCTPKDIHQVEKYLIRTLKPSRNPEKYVKISMKEFEYIAEMYRNTSDETITAEDVKNQYINILKNRKALEPIQSVLNVCPF